MTYLMFGAAGACFGIAIWLEPYSDPRVLWTVAGLLALGVGFWHWPRAR